MNRAIVDIGRSGLRARAATEVFLLVSNKVLGAGRYSIGLDTFDGFDSGDGDEERVASSSLPVPSRCCCSSEIHYRATQCRSALLFEAMSP